MKYFLIAILFPLIFSNLISQTPKTIKLNSPDINRGFSMMKTLSLRASTINFDSKKLKLQDLSDLVWAANGINRADQNKRTAPSAINAQDIDVYVIMEEGAFLYDAKNHLLNLVAEGDFRKHIAGRQEKMAVAPVFLLLVSDISRFNVGDDAQKMLWASEDAGIVSQNINLFCASVGLITRTRATMDIQKISEVLKLKETQHPILNNPVSYKTE